MARKVFISSDMSIDETLSEIAETDPLAAMMWPWLLTTFDDWGRALSSAKRLKASVFPMFGNVTAEYIETSLKLYSEFELIKIYEVDGKSYMSIDEQKWYKYQTHMNRKNRRPGKDKMESDHPLPEGFPTEPHGDDRGLLGSPQFPVPSPSPSPLITQEEEPMTALDAYTYSFKKFQYTGHIQGYVHELLKRGLKDAFIREVFLEMGARGIGADERYMRKLAEDWIASGIYTRAEASKRKVAAKTESKLTVVADKSIPTTAEFRAEEERKKKERQEALRREMFGDVS